MESVIVAGALLDGAGELEQPASTRAVEASAAAIARLLTVRDEREAVIVNVISSDEDGRSRRRDC
jgi:hypothetical protein